MPKYQVIVQATVDIECEVYADSWEQVTNLIHEYLNPTDYANETVGVEPEDPILYDSVRVSWAQDGLDIIDVAEVT